MTNKELMRYEVLKEKYFHDSELLELLDLHIRAKQNNVQIAIEEGKEISLLAASIAGVSELRTILSLEIEKEEEE